ncbi:MAG: thioredoxin [Candidatus Wallbacteria bacterium]|nr:thioredoxin [Candidatus Wallbacteria bacterium]
MATFFTDKDFEAEVLKHKGVVLVDFFAEWCGPCKMLAPMIDEIAKEYQDKIKVGKMDVDKSAETAGKYGIRSIPTLILFKDGVVMETQVGALPKKDLTSLISRYL